MLLAGCLSPTDVADAQIRQAVGGAGCLLYRLSCRSEWAMDAVARKPFEGEGRHRYRT